MARHSREGERLIIAIDFDGCLCKDAWPAIGKPRKRIIRRAQRAQARGHTLILWTCREGKALIDAIEWLSKQGLCCDYVNVNPPHRIRQFGNDCRKIGYDVLWDDRARRV